MTPDQKAAIADFYDQAREAIDGTGRHEGHWVTQAGRCLYCSCGWRIGQGKLDSSVPRSPRRTMVVSYREAHTHGPRPPGDRAPAGQ